MSIFPPLTISIRLHRPSYYNLHIMANEDSLPLLENPRNGSEMQKRSRFRTQWLSILLKTRPWGSRSKYSKLES